MDLRWRIRWSVIEAKVSHSEFVPFNNFTLKNIYSKTPQYYIIVYLLLLAFSIFMSLEDPCASQYVISTGA